MAFVFRKQFPLLQRMKDVTKNAARELLKDRNTRRIRPLGQRDGISGKPSTGFEDEMVGIRQCHVLIANGGARIRLDTFDGQILLASDQEEERKQKQQENPPRELALQLEIIVQLLLLETKSFFYSCHL